MLKIWNDEEALEYYNESFTPLKLTNYFFQAMSAIEFLHQHNIVASDVRGPNFSVYRNHDVKFNNLGSIVHLNNQG